jgi:hypothetical protein
MCQTKEKNIIIEYQGFVEFDTIGELISQLKVQIQGLEVRQATYKRLLNIMIEALENIYRYTEYFKEADVDAIQNYTPSFSIQHDVDRFVIRCSNPILNRHVPELDRRLSKLKDLNHQQLKELYKATIADGQFSDKGGAGLGIIEMVKSSDSIDFIFDKINDDFSIYTLLLNISAG